MSDIYHTVQGLLGVAEDPKYLIRCGDAFDTGQNNHFHSWSWFIHQAKRYNLSEATERLAELIGVCASYLTFKIIPEP